MSDNSLHRSQSLLAGLSFVTVALLTLLPILRNTYLPLVDLPNHIARHYLATVPVGPLDTYYDYSFSLVPNSAVDFAWLILGNGGDPVDFSRYTMAFYCLALIGSAMLLSRTLHGRWTMWPATVALVCYNACFFWGFQNFIVSVPFAILGLTIWLWSERRSIVQRVLLLAPIVLLIYLLHFFAFAILAVAVFGREIQRIVESGKNWKAMMTQAILLALPFVAPIAWLAFDVVTSAESPAGSFTAFGDMSRRFEVLQSTALGTGQVLTSALQITGLATFILLFLFVSAAFSKSIFGGLEVAQQMRGPLVMLSVFMILMPYWLNGVAWVHIRFPFVVVALFLASTQWRAIPHRAAILIAAVVVLLVAGRSVAVDRYAAMHSKQVEDFVALIADIPEGQRLIVGAVEPDITIKRHWHIGAYAVTYRNVFVPTLFQGVHSLKVRPEWADHATPASHAVPLPLLLRDWGSGRINPQLEFIRNWSEKYNYLVLIDATEATFADLPYLEQIGAKGRFSLSKVPPAE